MTKKLDTYIDSMIRKTLSEMLEYDGADKSPDAIFAFAKNKLDFPVSPEETKAALTRILARALKKFPIREDADAEEAVLEILSKRGYAETLALVDWTSCDYETLEAVHEALYYHGAPNLLYEY